MKELLEYCRSDRQRELVKAIDKHGSVTKAARVLGIDQANAFRSMRAIKKRANLSGYTPSYGMSDPVPDGFQVKGTSKFTKDDFGNPIWVKTDRDRDAIAKAMEEAMDAFTSELPRAKPLPAPEQYLNADILNQYTITDYHLGMKAWAKECGDDWDTDIAEKLLVDWFACAIERAPDAETAILAQIGDFLHWDGVDAVTPASGHLLDADTRFRRLIRIAIRVTRRVINMLLEKHRYVHVIMAEGNHDPASSMWLSELFHAFYEKEPRVSVDESAIPYYCYVFGKQVLFYHHGHKRSVANVDSVLVGMFKKEYGQALFATAHMGHKHCIDIKESNLMVVEQHPTLASKDAYAARGGWLSNRNASVITYHKQFGEVARFAISPDMVRELK